MKQELVEKVAERLARAHFGVTGEWAEAQRLSVAFIEAARYALALAERAAREAFKDGWFGARGSVPGLGLSVRPADTEAAVERAVDGGA